MQETTITELYHLTVKLRLHPTDIQNEHLHTRSRMYMKLCQRIANKVKYYSKKIQTNSVKIHHKLYYDMKKSFPRLVTNDIVSAYQLVASFYRGKYFYLSKLESKLNWLKSHNKRIPKKLLNMIEKINKSCMHFKSICIPFNHATDFSLNINKQEISLATFKFHRLHIKYTTSKYGYNQLINSKHCKSAKLIYNTKKKCWFLYLLIANDRPSQLLGPNIGIDQGIKNLITTSSGIKISGDTYFKRCSHLYKIYYQLQQKAGNGSRTAKRHLRQFSGRIKSYTSSYCHNLSKMLIDYIVKNHYGCVVLEKLTLLKYFSRPRSKELKFKYHIWPLSILTHYIHYKAYKSGLQIRYVFPAHTSDTCNKCGYRNSKARITRDIFRCPNCGDLDADINAAINISLKPF